MLKENNQKLYAISMVDKLKRIVFTLTLLAYSTHGVWNNDLIVWYSAKASAALHIHGFSLWMMYAAITTACAEMLYSVVTRQGEKWLFRYGAEAFLIFLILSTYSAILMAVNSN